MYPAEFSQKVQGLPCSEVRSWRTRLSFAVMVIASIIIALVALTPAATVRAQGPGPYQRVWAWEQTTTNQAITFVNLEGTQNVITVNIYRSDGTIWGVKTVTLAGFETYAVEPGDSDANGWNLPVVSTSASGHSTPTEDAAYGMVATSSKAFEAFGYTDEQRHAGSGYSAIWTQDAITAAWWGMWNYDGSDDKKDYFYIFNPGTTSAAVTVDLYKSDGTSISTTNLTVPAKRTFTVYPATDLASNPAANYNIGVSLSSDSPIHVSVYTQLGQDYDPGATPPWKTHDVVSGLFVPFITSCNTSEYVWTDAKTSGQQQSAARVTNPNNFAITVSEEWWTYNAPDPSQGNNLVATTTTVIPARGTAELPRPAAVQNSSGNDPRTHWRRLSAVQQNTTTAAAFHAHVSYFEQIDLPSFPKNEWFWGNFKPGNTDNVFLVNPTDDPITVKIQRWKNGSVAPIAGSQDIVLLPKVSIMAALPSEGAVPPSYGTSPISSDSAENQTWRFYSDQPFVLHIQDWDYGDLLPATCGAGAATLDYGDAPDTGQGTGTGNYNTLLADDGPRHLIFFENLRLGNRIDAENDGQPTTGADGDDLYGAVPDDEDGVDPADLTGLPLGGSALVDVSVTNNSGAAATLACWIDFDGDGSFEAGEQQTTTAVNGFSGVKTLTFAVPTDAVSSTYARCRISTDSTAASSPTGFALNGEVEDYQVTIVDVSLEIGDFVWWDSISPDGIQDPGESGIADVVVTLFDGNGVQLAQTTTDISGEYLFTQTQGGQPLLPGNYEVVFTLPPGYVFTFQNAGLDPELDSDADIVTGSTGVFSVISSDHSWDAGLVTPADIGVEIGDFVWYDLDYDGLQDANEPGVPGVLVTLYDGNGLLLNTTTTAANGRYLFISTSGGAPLTSGNYYVGFTLPYGYAFTLPNANANANDTIDSDANPANGLTGVLFVTTIDYTFDGGLVRTGSIGNYVWVDENSDGYEDAGEPGLPNIRVWLTDCSLGPDRVLATTYTDAHGGYLFANLAPGTYCVDVDESTLPAGMTQTTVYPNPGADLVNQNQGTNGYSVSLPAGGENLTADFGFNYNTTPCVDGDPAPACVDPTGAIGDHVWVDADGDGAQDPEEAGIPNVCVELVGAGADGIFGTPDDAVLLTTSTNGTGNYLFDGLAPGSYVVRMCASNFQPGGPLETYTQTGDPDHFGLPGGVNDNQTTTPVVLGPGDVFLNADFGYQPPANQCGNIGDLVWLDVNGNGAATPDAGEYGIPGVTVALIRDVNEDGNWQPGTEPVIATDTTDANGLYLFPCLPVTDGQGTDDYLVWVNDTNNVLAGLTPTYDSNGIATPNISAVSNLAPAGNLLQDFSYTPSGQNPGEGVIGDTIWLNPNGNSTQDAGEPGIEGVLVNLYTAGPDGICNSNDDVAAGSTVTDENGHYYFGGLAINTVTYCVVVDPTNFTPGGPLAGLANNYDPDGGLNNYSTVTLIPTNPIRLDQDFGYTPPSGQAGTIGDLVWNDLNADGVKQASEVGIVGVTIDLIRDLNGNEVVDAGEPVIATTTTGAGGSYLFSGLPTNDGTADSDVDYIVNVTDVSGVLAGYWHSLGTPTLNNNSQVDPYAVALTVVQPDNLTADFGYYVLPGAVGNRVWLDDQEPGTFATDKNGIQDSNEPGIANVKVTLTIIYPNGPTVTMVTLTDNTGYYSFGNLLLDEDFNGAGGPEPTHTITVDGTQATLVGYVVTVINAPSATACTDSATDKCNDSNDPAGTLAQPIEGQTDTSSANDSATISSYDFGYYNVPTSANLDYFEAVAQGNTVALTWATLNEVELLGFDVYRAQSWSGPWIKVNATLIPAQSPGSPQGHIYQLADQGLASGKYWYRLDWVEPNGTQVVAAAEVQVGSSTRKTWMPMVIK